jgi:hypothetical protein
VVNVKTATITSWGLTVQRRNDLTPAEARSTPATASSEGGSVVSDAIQDVQSWWASVEYNLCGQNIGSLCGTRVTSVADAVGAIASRYAAESWGDLGPEEVDQILRISDATERLAVLRDIYGSWPVNPLGEPYPLAIDPRTGQPIPPPTEDVTWVQPELRTPRLPNQRAVFIREWEARGYSTPAGGGISTIHHVDPLEYGGANDFWNLVPVLEGAHVDEFNA